MKKIFTDIAWKYERFNKLSSFGQYRSWLRTLIDKSPITSETLMLDIAGGTGDVTFTACARKQPKSIVLSDYTPAMLEVAQTRLDAGEANGVPVELAVVDGQDIPYEDESFDVITMSYGIRNMPERERALSEMYRVLKPGGALCVLEFSTPPNPLCAWATTCTCAGAFPLGAKSLLETLRVLSTLPSRSRLFPTRRASRAC